jgi:hypothetical protein
LSMADVQRLFGHSDTALQRLGFTGSINTALVERIDLTLRHGLAALFRRAWANAQLTPELAAHFEWWQAWYHFCQPHQGLRLKLAPLPRKGRQTPRGYVDRTPATPALALARKRGASVAAGLVDHVWSVEELLLYPVG